MKFTYLETEYDIDDELSFKNFTGFEFYSRPEYDFSNKIVYQTCFSQETPDSDIFKDVRGATFIKCNMDNVLIPDGNTVIDCWQRRYKVQNDLNDWLVDTTDKPTMPIDHKIFTKFGLPIPDPKDIPADKVEKVIDLRKEAERIRDELPVNEVIL